jgi:hypothetical protein
MVCEPVAADTVALHRRCGFRHRGSPVELEMLAGVCKIAANFEPEITAENLNIDARAWPDLS